MKVLLLHHFETMWSESLEKYDTNFENQMNKYIDYILSNKDLDKVIVTRFEGFDFEPEHQALISCCEHLNINIECIEYAYGWSKDMNEDLFVDENEGTKWCYGTRDHHDGINDVLIIDDWMRDLKGSKVIVGGSFAGECVLDILTVLGNIDLELVESKDLIVGEYIDYDFKTQIEDIYAIINDTEELSYKYDEIESQYNISVNSDFNLIKKELLEIEDKLNNAIYKNIDLIKIFGLENDIYEIINNEKFQEIVENIIDTEKEFKDYSNIDKKNKQKIKKLKPS